MTNEDAVDFVQKILKKPIELSEEKKLIEQIMDFEIKSKEEKLRSALKIRKMKMARYMAKEALKRGSQDNVTIIILFLT